MAATPYRASRPYVCAYCDGRPHIADRVQSPQTHPLPVRHVCRWRILSRAAPTVGVSSRAPDGVENVAVFRRGLVRGVVADGSAGTDGSAGEPGGTSGSGGHEYVLIYSEGLRAQHLAYALSADGMETWRDGGAIAIAPAAWMAGRYGAPFVWSEAGCWWMALMGESELKLHASAVGLLYSADGSTWHVLAEREGAAGATADGDAEDRETPPQVERGARVDSQSEKGEPHEEAQPGIGTGRGEQALLGVVMSRLRTITAAEQRVEGVGEEEGLNGQKTV